MIVDSWNLVVSGICNENNREVIFIKHNSETQGNPPQESQVGVTNVLHNFFGEKIIFISEYWDTILSKENLGVNFLSIVSTVTFNWLSDCSFVWFGAVKRNGVWRHSDGSSGVCCVNSLLLHLSFYHQQSERMGKVSVCGQMKIPHPPARRAVPPSGYMGVLPTGLNGATPLETEQHREYLLRGGQ